MKKSIWIFLLAVILPSVVLGWLALRSAEEQQIILERRTAELFQKETDNVAASARRLIAERQNSFNEVVRNLLAKSNAKTVSSDFAHLLATAWSQKAVGFVIDENHQIVSPSRQAASANQSWQSFLVSNRGFLGGTAPAPVYWVAGNDSFRGEITKGQLQTNTSSQGAWRSSSKDSPMKAKKVAAPVTAAPSAEKYDAVSPPQTAAEGRARNKVRSNTPQAPSAGLANVSDEKKENRPEEFDQRVQLPSTADPKPAPAEKPANVSSSLADTSLPREDQDQDKLKAMTDGGSASQDRIVTLEPPPVIISGESKSYRSANAAADFKEFDAGAEGTARLRKRDLDDDGIRQIVAPVDDQFAEAGLKQEIAQTRNVAPQRLSEPQQTAPLSELVPDTADFRALTSEASEGVITRFVQDKLEIIFWQRPPQDSKMVFGCLIEAESLRELWKTILPSTEDSGSYPLNAPREFVLALLDDKGRPVAVQPQSEGGRDWKRPFVASEIGEVLPHWEAALYLMQPQQLEKSAKSLRRNLILLIVAALGAIACGGWMMVADARRHLALAQKKTDFVSNVSHELKTPLTSIRMFAELMQQSRPDSVEKHPQYLRIILVEAERLTRLINNVLDFARIERKQKQLHKNPVDLHAIIARVWEGQELHLQENGFTTKWQAASEPYPVLGDDDALSQILVNLISNAEKYSCNGEREIELHSYLDGDFVCVSVLDRGSGVPHGQERKIFDAFYRAHDSLSSGIQGSGLGLTLAQRLAREQGGEILFQQREGGGSNFTLRLPLNKTTEFEDQSS